MRLSQLSRSIDDSVALITGAASGMGRATARLFADEGARLGLLDINEDKLLEVAEEIRAAGNQVFTVAVDLANRDEVVKAVGAIVERFGGLDILINNAGLIIPAEVDGPNYPESWDTSFAVMATAHWGEDGIWYRWSHGGVEATATALRG